MNKKQRVQAVVEGRPVAYLPSQLDFVPHRLAQLQAELNIRPEDCDDWADNHFLYLFPLGEACCYSSGSLADEALANRAIAKGLIAPHDNPRIVCDSFRVGWLKNTTGVRDVEHPLAGADIDRYRFPNPDAPGMFDHQLADLQARRDEMYVVGLQHLLFHERSFLLMGYENYILTLATDPDRIGDLLDRILEYHLGIARRYIELKVDAVRTGDDYGTQQSLQVSPATWRKLFKPRLARLWEAYRQAGVTVMHHSCGNIEAIIPDLIEIGLQVLHPIQPLALDIARLAERFGDRLVFHGGIDTQHLLPFGAPAEVKEAVRHCVEVLGDRNRYVIAPSQEIMNDVPTENIIALKEGIRDFRGLWNKK